MTDILGILHFLASFGQSVSALVDSSLILRIAVGLPLFAVCAYTILLYKGGEKHG